MAKFLRTPFFLQNTCRGLLLKFAQYLFLESFFVSLDKSALLHHRCFMSKSTEMLMLAVCRKIYLAFYPTLHESSSNSYGFALQQEFNIFYPQLALYDRKHFCSILTDLSNLLFLFHKIKQWMWRMFLPNSFQKCRSSRSQMFFRSSRPEMFCKKLFLEISQNSQENICARAFLLLKLQVKVGNFI